jgi:hypothetical protein
VNAGAGIAILKSCLASRSEIGVLQYHQYIYNLLILQTGKQE